MRHQSTTLTIVRMSDFSTSSLEEFGFMTRTTARCFGMRLRIDSSG